MIFPSFLLFFIQVVFWFILVFINTYQITTKRKTNFLKNSKKKRRRRGRWGDEIVHNKLEHGTFKCILCLSYTDTFNTYASLSSSEPYWDSYESFIFLRMFGTMLCTDIIQWKDRCRWVLVVWYNCSSWIGMVYMNYVCFKSPSGRRIIYGICILFISLNWFDSEMKRKDSISLWTLERNGQSIRMCNLFHIEC